MLQEAYTSCAHGLMKQTAFSVFSICGGGNGLMNYVPLAALQLHVQRIAILWRLLIHSIDRRHALEQFKGDNYRTLRYNYSYLAWAGSIYLICIRTSTNALSKTSAEILGKPSACYIVCNTSGMIKSLCLI